MIAVQTHQRFRRGAFGALLLTIAAASLAQVSPPELQPLSMTSEPGPRAFRVERSGRFNGKRVSYTIEVAETLLRDASGQRTASLFSCSYIATKSAANRPVIFAFNGGPGFASAWMNFNALGPKILARELDVGVARLPLVDNPLSPLDVADLVFPDPVDTGYSYNLSESSKSQFYSIDGDSEAMSQLVINWLRTHGRLSSPVYLIGESYGTMRAVAMVRDLARGAPAVKVAGVMLAGNSLNYRQRGRIPEVSFKANALPMMASVAWYHGRIDNKGQTWAQAVGKAQSFARGPYVGALMMGYRLDEKTREEILRQLPSLIGIPESYFRKNHTIVVADFKSELLRDKGLVLDGDDGRITHLADEPGDRNIDLYRKAMEGYASELGVTGLGGYNALNLALNPRWNYVTAGAMTLDVTLAQAAKDNPALRIMLVQGRYDTLTTIGNSEYVMAQSDLPWERYVQVNYDGGHMLIAQPEAMSAIRTFVSAH